MQRASFQRHAAVAALFAAPILVSGGSAMAQRRHKPPKPPPAAVVGDTQKATQHFLKGSELFKAKKFIPALEQFKQSYAIVPSPNSHLYIARCMAAIGETRAAWLEFDKVAEEAAARAATEPKYAPTRDSANLERDELSNKLGLLTVEVQHVDPAAVVHVGRWEVPRERWGRPFPVDPGTYDATLRAPNGRVVKTTITLARGNRRAVMLDGGGRPGPVAQVGPKPVSRGFKMTPLRIGGFAAAGVGVAGMVMFAVAGAMSQSTYSSLKLKCGGDTGGCRGLDVSSDISKGQTQQALANTGLIVGIVGLAAGGMMIGLSFRGRKESPRTADLVVGPSFTGFKGTF
jgi:hypothetical protein